MLYSDRRRSPNHFLTPASAMFKLVAAVRVIFRGQGNRMQTKSLVPMVFVADVERSAAFYGRLGFTVNNTFTPEGSAAASWAWLMSGDAQLMVALATHPVAADQQAVLFYVYTDDVAAARASLVEAGLDPGAIATPFYSPRGEFRLVDPDGYVMMVTHT